VGRKKRTVCDHLACQLMVRRVKPLGGSGRAWSRGETWTGEVHDVARTEKEGDVGVWKAGATHGAVEERGPDAGKGADMAADRRTSCEAGENRGSGLVGRYGPTDVGLA
jgi:hypothetical protein